MPAWRRYRRRRATKVRGVVANAAWSSPKASTNGRSRPSAKTKVPYYITTNDQPIFAFAGLWDSSKTDSGERIESVTHITLPANDLADYSSNQWRGHFNVIT